MKIKGISTKEKVRNNDEKIISDKIAKKLNGKREICLTDNKRIDILTSINIIEVKNFNKRLNIMQLFILIEKK
jgi:hypothetical protein